MVKGWNAVLSLLKNYTTCPTTYWMTLVKVLRLTKCFRLLYIYFKYFVLMKFNQRHILRFILAVKCINVSIQYMHVIMLI